MLLAPMEDVSYPPFRAVCKDHGADMMYTEFISSEGLIRDAVKSVRKLDIFEYERPIGIQLYGSEIDSMREAAEIADEANPDLIDINYGCPVKGVACRGAGAGLLRDIPKMVAMTANLMAMTKELDDRYKKGDAVSATYCRLKFKNIHTATDTILKVSARRPRI